MGEEKQHRLHIGVEVDDSSLRHEFLVGLEGQLQTLDIVALDRVEISGPPGSKSATGLTTQLVATMAPGAISIGVALMTDWLRRRRDGCKLILQLDGDVSAEITNFDDIDAIMEQLTELGYPPPER